MKSFMNNETEPSDELVEAAENNNALAVTKNIEANPIVDLEF